MYGNSKMWMGGSVAVVSSGKGFSYGPHSNRSEIEHHVEEGDVMVCKNAKGETIAAEQFIGRDYVPFDVSMVKS